MDLLRSSGPRIVCSRQSFVLFTVKPHSESTGSSRADLCVSEVFTGWVSTHTHFLLSHSMSTVLNAPPMNAPHRDKSSSSFQNGFTDAFVSALVSTSCFSASCLCWWLFEPGPVWVRSRDQPDTSVQLPPEKLRTRRTGCNSPPHTQPTSPRVGGQSHFMPT